MPVAGFIADFACPEAKLVLELDGGQHAEGRAYDLQRDRKLASEGFRVLRFWDNEVFSNTEGVLTAILEALKSGHPHPDLPPQAEEGGSLNPHPSLPPQTGEGGGLSPHPNLPPQAGEGD